MGFEERLRALDTEFDPANNPFTAALKAGTLPIKNICAYAQRAHYMGVIFPALLNRILEICPVADVRAHIQANLDEEEGRINGVCIPEKRHTFFTQRFLDAVEARCGSRVPTHEAPAANWYSRMAAQGDWLSCIAYIFIGMENGAARTYPHIIGSLRRQYGFTTFDLEHFIHHVAADREHGDMGLRLILEHAKTPEEQARAYQGARRGSRSWWTVHEYFARSSYKAVQPA